MVLNVIDRCVKYLFLPLLVLVLFSCDKIKDTCSPDETTEVYHFTKLGGIRILPIKNKVSKSGIKLVVSCYKDLINEKSKEKLKREETDSGYELSTEWFVLLIPKDGSAMVLTVMPNDSGRSRNVYLGFKAETEFKINIIQR